MSPCLYFRDKSSAENLENGREYHAAGLVAARHNTNCPSGKDLLVTFLDPFYGHVVTAWRGDAAVELYEVNEFEWQALRDRYEAIEGFDGTPT